MYILLYLQKKLKAEKTITFKSLSSFLIFLLKRFKFNLLLDTEYTLNDYFEFPLELDKSKYTLNYIYDNIKNKYEYYLKSIVIHNGSCRLGHYYNLIKDPNSKKWFKFNDTDVTLFKLNNYVEEAFETIKGSDYINENNAYLLFYEN